MVSAGLVALAGYLPGQQLDQGYAHQLSQFLKAEVLLPAAYTDSIANDRALPGHIETNYEGWEKRPWFESWLNALPECKKDDPFQGTKERRRVPADPDALKTSLYPHPMLPSDAETLAAGMVLFNSKVNKAEIDLVLVASQIPDLPLPLNASLIQHKLGLSNAGAYSIDTCCSSFVTLLEVACGMVKSGIKQKILIISSYIDSHVTDRSDYFSVNTGDASFAGIVAPVKVEFGYQGSHSTSHGERHKGIIVENRSPGLYKKTGLNGLANREFVTFSDHQARSDIAKFATVDMIFCIRKALTKSRIRLNQIDFMVTHQPVHWAPHAWREALGIPREKFLETFKKYGNIANCSVPANLLEAILLGKVTSGNLVLMASSGAGENHIALLDKLSPELIKCCTGVV